LKNKNDILTYKLDIVLTVSFYFLFKNWFY